MYPAWCKRSLCFIIVQIVFENWYFSSKLMTIDIYGIVYRKYWWRLLRYVGKRCFEGFRNVPVFIVRKVICLFLLFGSIGFTTDTAQVVVSLVMEKKKQTKKKNKTKKTMKTICWPILSVFVMLSFFFFRIKNMILKKGLMKAVNRL